MSGIGVSLNEFPASRKSTYLNAASVALMYRGAERAAVEWQEDVAGNGTIHFDEATEEAVFEDLHRVSARLFNARADDIAVASSATELLCSLAWAVAPGPETNMVSTDVEFPSAVYPWARVARNTGFEIRLARGTNGYVKLDDIRRLVDSRTAVVCLSHVEYASGQRFDLTDLAEVTHAHGALLVVDATQSAGAVPIDVTASGVDALVTAGYKWLCGPFGAAVMYLAPHLQGDLDPGLVGFRSHKDVWDLKPDRLELSETARRFEFSTMGYGLAVGLTRSIDYLLQVGVDRVFEHNLRLANRLIEGLRKRNGEVLSPENEKERSSIVSVRFPGKESSEIARNLKDARVMVSARGGAVRFSPHLYNTVDDIERALDELDRCVNHVESGAIR